VCEEQFIGLDTSSRMAVSNGMDSLSGGVTVCPVGMQKGVRQLSCADVFADPAVLGSGAKCVLSPPHGFSVLLGNQPQFLRDLLVGLDLIDSSAGTGTGTGVSSVGVDYPSGVLAPTADIIGPSDVNACEDSEFTLTLEMPAASSGGLPVDVTWGSDDVELVSIEKFASAIWSSGTLAWVT
jgi:hypothetical protein